jgi:hypothetical protein
MYVNSDVNVLSFEGNFVLLHTGTVLIVKCILFVLQLQKYKPIIIVPTFSSEKSMKNTEGVPRGRGLAAPESVCLLSISFR